MWLASEEGIHISLVVDFVVGDSPLCDVHYDLVAGYFGLVIVAE
jgi:hypothetical protein